MSPAQALSPAEDPCPVDPRRASLLALAFTLAPWPERRKAEIWTALQDGLDPAMTAREQTTLARLEADLPRLQSEAAHRGARLVLPWEGPHLWPRLPYPVALWVRGSLPPATCCLAIVGSRQASPQGRERARTWARELTAAGVGILSGLARGIDGEAHGGALEVGSTWGILGSGLDHPYPREHRGLMDRMVATGGGVLTPFPPAALPLQWHFPRRNVLLAAWAAGVVLVEARLRSGSLVTVRLALDLGREVWACPGPPENDLSEGPNSLLREGSARIARGVADILQDLGDMKDLTSPAGLGP
jgi:DNA processing protein